nr:MAG TPA: hypothetical protein [Caudoviricetes sp.]
MRTFICFDAANIMHYSEIIAMFAEIIIKR